MVCPISDSWLEGKGPDEGADHDVEWTVMKWDGMEKMLDGGITDEVNVSREVCKLMRCMSGNVSWFCQEIVAVSNAFSATVHPGERNAEEDVFTGYQELSSYESMTCGPTSAC